MELYPQHHGNFILNVKNHYGTITQEFIDTNEGAVMNVIIYTKRDIKTDGTGGPWYGGVHESENFLLSTQYLTIESVVNVDNANYGLMCVDETTQSMNLPSDISPEMGDGILETFKTKSGKIQRLTFAYSNGTQTVHMRFYSDYSRKWFPWAKNN